MRKRAHGLLIRFTDIEFAALDARAQKAGLPREIYCRKVLKGAEVIEAPDLDTQHLIHELRAIRSELEALAPAWDASLMPSVSKLLDRAAEAENEIIQTFKGRVE